MADAAPAAAAAVVVLPLEAAASAQSTEQLQFGWVPAHVISDLQEVGDWKRRAAAVEVLHGAARAATARDPHLLLASFSAFLDFFLPLLGDPNFKIATSSVTILEAVVAGLGPGVSSYLGTLTPALAGRLGDTLPLARGAAARGLAALARAAGPQPVVNMLGSALEADAWRVREGALNVATALLLGHGRGAFDYPRVVAVFVAALADDQPRVATAALEGLALLHARLGPLLQGLLTAVGAGEGAKARVVARVAATPELGLPQLGADGEVQHQPHARPPSAEVHSAEATQPVVASRNGSLTAAAAHAAAHAATAELPATSAWVNPRQQTLGHAASLPTALQPGNPTAGLDRPSSAGMPLPLDLQLPVAAGLAAIEQHEQQLQQVERSDGSLLTWVRPARSPNASFTSAVQAPQAASAASLPLGAPPASNRAPPQLPASMGRSRPCWKVRGAEAPPNPAATSHTPAVAAAPQDLHVSVRAWQQQQEQQQLAGSVGIASEERVEASRGSLLQWRMPPRGTAPAARGPPSKLTGGPGLLQKLGSFRKKLFGLEEGQAVGALQQQQQQQQPEASMCGTGTGAASEPGSPARLSWSIPAVHGRMRSSEAVQQAAALLPSAPALQEQQLEEQQPASPSSILGKLRQLKARQQEAAERRRVWSAPAQPAPGGDSVSRAGAAGGEQALPGQLPPGRDGSTRPGLQALKSRARTARQLSAGSKGARSSLPAPDPLYSLEALDEVFGPDRMLPSQPPGLHNGWSPLRAALPVGDDGVPMLQRQASGAGQSSWPSSPGGSVPGSPARAKRSSSSAFLSKLSASPLADGSASSSGPVPTFLSATSDLSPLEAPEAAMADALAALAAAAASQRRELDWQAQLGALATLRRLVRHHASVLLPSLHAVVTGAAPAIDSLRSVPARLALVVFQELISAAGPALEPELEAFVPRLLKRAGAVSVAGRDSFLAVEADRALASLVSCGTSGARVVAALLAALAVARSPDMRAKAATHLAAACATHGATLVGATAASLHGRLLRAAAGLLEEGNPEARASARRMVLQLHAAMETAGGTGAFRAAVARLDCHTDGLMEVAEPGSGRQGPGPLPAGRVPSTPWTQPPSGRTGIETAARQK